MGVPPEVQQILDKHAGRFSVTAEGKVKCELNGHTFPARLDALASFINGKKYARLVKQAEVDAGLSKYEPFVVRSRNLPGMLFCALTGELLNARLEEVKAHLKGRKFARAKERFEADEQELLEEPDMQGSDLEDEGAEGGEEPGFWVPEGVLQEHEMGDAEAEEADGQGADGIEAEAGEAAAGGAPPAAPAAAGKAKAGKQKQAANKPAAAASSGGKARQKQRQGSGDGGKQQKQAEATGNGGSGKAKPPRAKKARLAS